MNEYKFIYNPYLANADNRISSIIMIAIVNE